MAPLEVTTVAGSGVSGHLDGLGVAAKFTCPLAITFDSVGNLFVVDNHCIRKVHANGAVTTIAGLPEVDGGSQDGVGAAARFNQPHGLAADKYDNLYVADCEDHCIRKITPDGTVTTLAGNDEDGYVDGLGAASRFDCPYDVAVDDDCNVYVAECLNYRIRKVTPAGQVTTLAGSGDEGHADGLGTAASFSCLVAIAIDRAGTLYVCDHHRVRKITPEGSVTTLAGQEQSGRADGLGAAASFSSPRSLTVDAVGNLYVADTYSHLIRKVTPEGQVTTLAGSGTQGHVNGIGTAASFHHPYDLALDASGNLLVADAANHRIRRIEAVASPPQPPADPASSSFFGDMAALLDDTSLADVTFAVGDERITAHRVVLAARSPYVSVQLSNPALGLLHASAAS